MIALEDISFLTSTPGDRLLERLATENLSDANTLPLLTALRRAYTADQTRAALEMARLRMKAVTKFGADAGRMFFTREALEQASDPLIRNYRASRITQNNPSVVDAGCGIGADTLAFAAAGAAVLGIDIDPVRVAIARHNATALGLAARFEVGDVGAGLPDAEIAFFDPARRDDDGKRLFDVERYQPPLSVVRGWRHARIVVKLSPGAALEQVAAYDGGVEFISVNGDLKEAVLWLGDGSRGTRATLLIGGQVRHWQSGEDRYNASPVIASPRAWLVEPDPALLRAGLVADAAAAYGGAQLDPTIAYFTTDDYPTSPWLRAWKIHDWLPFNLKRLRAYLRERSIGSVTVKKRGSAITPESLIASLKLKGDRACTLVLTRCNGEPIVLICAVAPGRAGG
jgi:SAM-dependent methyltransferase